MLGVWGLRISAVHTCTHAPNNFQVCCDCSLTTQHAVEEGEGMSEWRKGGEEVDSNQTLS